MRDGLDIGVIWVVCALYTVEMLQITQFGLEKNTRGGVVEAVANSSKVARELLSATPASEQTL